MIRVVTGPPCAGKSTYVQDNRGPDDVVVDFDLIAKALGSGANHRPEGAVRDVAFAARDGAVTRVLAGVASDAWLIHTSPTGAQVAAYEDAKAEFIELDPGIDVCLARAQEDGRPNGTAESIAAWYAARDQSSDTTKSATSPDPRRVRMKTKNAAVAVKAGPEDGLDEGQFTAYASVFGNVDSYGDVVVKGAFAKTLATWAAKDAVLPLLFGHRLDDPDYNIGHIVTATEDDRGLLVTGQLDLESPKAQQVYRLLKGRRIDQMSFAYDIVEGVSVTTDGEHVYELRELDLYEVSVVPIGANSETEILAVKAACDALAAGAKAGRVISAKNESELRKAHDAIGNVLAALGTDDDQEKASGHTNATASTVPQELARATGVAETQEPRLNPSADTVSTQLKLLALA